MPGKSCLERGKRGVWGWSGCFFSPSSAKTPMLGDRSKESNESWIPDPVKSRLITREARTGHFQDENCCQIMFPVKVCQTGRTSWVQLILGTLICWIRAPQSSFQSTWLFAYIWPTWQQWEHQQGYMRTRSTSAGKDNTGNFPMNLNFLQAASCSKFNRTFLPLQTNLSNLVSGILCF